MKIAPIVRKLKHKWKVCAAKDTQCLHSKKAEKELMAGYILAPYIPCEVKRRVR